MHRMLNLGLGNYNFIFHRMNFLLVETFFLTYIVSVWDDVDILNISYFNDILSLKI